MTKPRLLTEYEIESMLSFIKPQSGIPKETAMSVVNLNKKGLREQLKCQKIYPDMIPALGEMIEKQFMASKVQSGESVGVIGAQSIGEKQTQTTLNTFHTAGSGNKTITTGVPRVEELLNVTKEPKSVSCIVYMDKKHNSIAKMRETISYQVVEMTFERISLSYDIVMNKPEEKWYESFKILYSDKFTKYTDCVSLKIDLNLLYEYKLDMETIANIIDEKYEDMTCVFSPGNISREKGKNIGQIDVFVDTSDIDLPESRLIFINSENAKEIYLEEVVQPILYGIIICGIPGIENIYFNEDGNSFETEGSNFQKLLGLSFVKSSETVSNNVWDIYHNLGVEAARQFLIEEFMGLMSGINRCHIQLLVEKMTYGGSISSISRYAMRNEECGPMGKASFEETMDNFLKAGVYGQDEATRGVSASIICGKIAQIGSGVCDLIMDNNAFYRVKPIIDDFVMEKKIKDYELTDIKVKSSEGLEKRLTKKRSKLKNNIEEMSQQMTYLDL